MIALNYWNLKKKKCSLPDLKGDNLLSTLKDGVESQGPLCLTILPLQQTSLIFKMNQCMNVKISESLYFWNFHQNISFHVSEFSIEAQALSDSSLPEVVRIIFLGIMEVIFYSILVSLIFLFLCLRKDTLKHWNRPLGKWILIFLDLQALTCFCFPWGVYNL